MVIGTIMLLEPIGSLVCGDLLQLDDKQSVNLETKKHIIAATYTCLPVHADKFDKNCDKQKCEMIKLAIISYLQAMHAPL